ncbi:hypothetical protein, partial [Treponema sp. R6D11]
TLDSKLKEKTEDKSLVFTNLGAEETPSVGDIICSWGSTAVPDGFFCRVKTVTTVGDETVITTEPAKLEDALENVEAEDTFEMSFGDFNDGDGLAEGVTVEFEDENSNPRAAASGSLGSSLPIFKINKNVKGVTLAGSIRLGSTFAYDIKTEDFTMKRFEISTGPRIKADLTASISGKVEKEISFEIFEKKLPSIKFVIGVVPVVITPKISIEAVISTEGKVTVSAKLVELDYSYIFGVQYTEAGKIKGFQRNTSQPAKFLEGVRLDLSGEIKVKPKAAFMFGLYDMAYAGVSAGLYAKFEGESGNLYRRGRFDEHDAFFILRRGV